MRIEHIAFNVSDPVAIAAWYCQHLGFRIVRQVPGPSQTHFIADADGTTLEIYCNPPDAVPDYRAMNPLVFHLAFHSADPAAEATRLEQAGAQLIEEVFPDEGSHLVMLRDPWGLSIQLCRRSKPLIAD